VNNGLFGNRNLFWLIVLATATAMASALYLQYVVGLVVCPLCLTQRVFFVAAGTIAFVAALHNPGHIGRRIYAFLGLLMTAGGIGFAGRHIWLQYLPPEEVPACGPSLEYMLETLPFAETFKVLLMGDGNCAETLWTLLGLSIPELAMAVFMFIASAFLVLLMRK
jgi:disulfide bond formation protein DsbB